MSRSKGISTLIACQNEEATVGWCILSFLEFSDEIIVVDNGSTDASKEICREMARRYPGKVAFHDIPHLKDLYENRQYAFERSRYNWIVRADSDYVCYTDGDYDCRKLRKHLLSRPFLSRPEIYHLFEPTVYGDYWHTGDPLCERPSNVPAGCGVTRRMPVVSSPQPRIYRWVPGMRFCRMGRTEGVMIPRGLRRMLRRIKVPTPIWMECNIKSETNMLFRSERTNWRELGDFKRYPDLESYVTERLEPVFGESDLDAAAFKYAETHFYPYLKPYQPEEVYPYPRIVKWAMEQSPVYQIFEQGGQLSRKYMPLNIEALHERVNIAE